MRANATDIIEIRHMNEKDKIARAIGSLSVSDILMAAAVFLYCFSYSLGLSELSENSSLSSIIASLRPIAVIVLLARVALFTKYEWYEYCLAGLMCGFALLSAYKSGDSTILFLILFPYCAKDSDFRTICKSSIWALGLSITIVVLLSLFDVIDDRITYATNELLGGIITERHSFGFTHQNNLGQLFVLLYLGYIYLRFSSFSKTDCLIWIIISYWLFFIVSTKTAAITIILGLFLIAFAKLIDSDRFIFAVFIFTISIILVNFILIFAYHSGNVIALQINQLLTGRIRSASLFLSQFPITFFGQYIEFVSTLESARTGISAFVLDNAYTHLLLRYGVVMFCTVVGMYFMVLRKVKKVKNSSLAIIVLLLFSVGLSELWMITLCGTIILCSFKANLTCNLVIR